MVQAWCSEHIRRYDIAHLNSQAGTRGQPVVVVYVTDRGYLHSQQ
jgi:hypothetical protein